MCAEKPEAVSRLNEGRSANMAWEQLAAVTTSPVAVLWGLPPLRTPAPERDASALSRRGAWPVLGTPGRRLPSTCATVRRFGLSVAPARPGQVTDDAIPCCHPDSSRHTGMWHRPRELRLP